MATWHGYFAVIRLNIGIGNWDTLQTMFKDMGKKDSPMPAFNNHKRTRLGGDAVIYESMFEASEVSIAAFKAMLADTWGVPVEDILHTVGSESYSGGETVTWTFWYDAIEAGKDRFRVERFGGGGSTWQESGNETRGYLLLYCSEWGDC